MENIHVELMVVKVPKRVAYKPKPAVPIPKKTGPVYKVTYDYEATDDTQLSLVKGETIDIVEEGEENGWWLGKIGGVEGWVPSAFLEKQ